MDAGLDEDTDLELRVFVERVVRPIHAEESRKLKMRRELLGHVTAAYEDEASRQPTGALDRAVERMGDPAVLTEELQAGVSWWERFTATHDQLIRRRSGTPRWMHALLLVAIGAGQFAALFGTVVLLAILGLISPSVMRPGVAQRFLLFLFTLLTFNLFQGTIIAGIVRDRIASDAPWRDRLRTSIGWASLGGVLMLASGLLAWPIVGAPSVMWSTPFAVSWLLLSICFVAGVVGFSVLDVRERRGLEEWLELTLD